MLCTSGEKELEKIKEIDLILGNNEKGEIVEHVEDYIKIKKNKHRRCNATKRIC